MRRTRGASLVSLTLSAALAGAPVTSARSKEDPDRDTRTPIEHVIVVIAENRSFDHVFGTYTPKHGQTVSNLLSRGIVNADGTPGPNFAAARQFTVPPQAAYYIGAPAKTPYAILPPPDTLGAHTTPSDTAPPPFATLGAASAEPDLEPGDLILLTTGATGLPTRTVDTRVTNATNLPNGPFQLTGATMPYDAYTGDTIHRFYQMWQQSDCSPGQATRANPSGCLSDLYPFVNISFSTNDNGVGNPMAFFNVNDGDAPFLKQLADQFTSSDNFHQSFMGGTAANHVMLGTGDAVFFSDGNGAAITPPATIVIANPNPRPATNNTYTADGNWSDCSDAAHPGVGPIVSYLASLPYHLRPNCAAGHFYMLNNVNPGFLPNGQPRTTGTFVPPSSVRTIGDALSEKNISWRYYGGGFNAAVAGLPNAYCQICNPFQYAASIMANAAARQEHLKDTVDLLSDLRNGTLPAVSFAKPDGLLDGHPQSSKVGLFEAYLKNILATLDTNPRLKAHTAVLVTFDETGGYYDSGFIQPLDFFGDGPRIPLIVVSPYSRGGRVVHTYTDHVSVLKFIERNWGLTPLTDRSRDNLPNPVARRDDPYVPANMPAIGDLFDMFRFGGDHDRD
jgi:acid phosphatase